MGQSKNSQILQKGQRHKMTKDLKYANTSNRLDTGQLKFLKDKKVKYGIGQICQTQFFPGF